MKKFFLGALALVAVAAFSSCDKSGEKATTTADSLSMAYGKYVGTMIQGDFNQISKGEKGADQDFLRGMQVVFGANGNQNQRMGMQVALQMLNELNHFEETGLKVDNAAVLNAFKAAFLNDSISTVESTMATTEFRRIYQAAEAQAEEAAAAAKAEEPDAKANAEAAATAVEELKATNPEAKTTESGLTYVIEEEGVAPKADANATVEVNYTGKHLNGEIFDSTDGRGPATFNLQGVVPGFREGIMLLGKGGKATLYIPGNLAYGPNGQPQAGIGPNEMLVFDVEVLDINPAN